MWALALGVAEHDLEVVAWLVWVFTARMLKVLEALVVDGPDEFAEFAHIQPEWNGGKGCDDGSENTGAYETRTGGGDELLVDFQRGS